MGHDELACITDACGMYQTILDEADTWGGREAHSLPPDEEIRIKMPLMLAQLSPAARAALRDHLEHVRGLVAWSHDLCNRYDVRAEYRGSA